MAWKWRPLARLRESETFGKLLPYMFHVAMVVGVLCYIVVGAYIIRSDDNWEYWTMKDSILFCYTIITTIGYGNVAPASVLGRVFVILYGLVGIPTTMLVIANLGKFLAQLLRQFLRHTSSLVRCLTCRVRKRTRSAEKAPFVTTSSVVARNGGVYAVVDANHIQHAVSAAESEKAEADNDDDDDSDEDDEDGKSPHKDALVLFAAFIVYIVAGSWIIAAYEPHMDYFKAVYFNFVTLTTIGLGDLVPESESYLLFTLVYCSIGLALTTIAIEISVSANYLRRLHYYGRQIDKVANVKIWFGAKKLTMKQLVKNLGEQFNLPETELEELDLEKFVDGAIKVESGELATLRSGPALSRGRPLYITDLRNAFKEGRVLYVDEEDEFVISSRKASSRSGSSSGDSMPPIVTFN